MKNFLYGLFFAVRNSFWFIPTLLLLASAAGAFAVMEIDAKLLEEGPDFLKPFSMPISGARLAVSTIAGSMMTVASLVFSMTLVALTMISQQLGPRVMFLFMDDRPTQVVLGVFVATFTFALIVLLKIGDVTMAGRVPGLAVMFTAILALVSLVLMIHFIHHIATRIQADVLIAQLGADLQRAAEQFAEQGRGEENFASEEECRKLDRLTNGERGAVVALETSGYLLRIDADSAVRLARDNDLLLRMDVRAGEFLIAGRPAISVFLMGEDSGISDELADRLRSLVVIGARRTPEATIEFEINALVEVALRALSPGVNDPYTAIACIDRLADGLRVLMKRTGEQRVARDSEGVIRMVHVAEQFSRYVETAFEGIRQSAISNLIVLRKLKAVFEFLDSQSAAEHHMQSIARQRRLVDNHVARCNSSESAQRVPGSVS